MHRIFKKKLKLLLIYLLLYLSNIDYMDVKIGLLRHFAFKNENNFHIHI